MSFTRTSRRDEMIDSWGLGAFDRACQRVGLQFHFNKNKFRTHEGLRPCLHAASIPLPKQAELAQMRKYHTDFEIGLVAHVDNAENFQLACDSYGGAIEALAGGPTGPYDRLMMFYKLEAAKEVAAANGCTSWDEVQLPDGSVELHAEMA